MRLRFSVGWFANIVAWGVVAGLVGAALLVVNRLGFVGLMLLGGATALVCTRAELDQDTPTWGVAVLKARLGSRRSPEEGAASRAEREALLSPLRFYRWCGIALVVVGAIGFGWQSWSGTGLP